MQKMMARKVWSIRIVNFSLCVFFILWVGSLKYGYDFIKHANLIQDNMFNQSMYEFDMLDLDQYYNFYEYNDDQDYDQDEYESGESEDYVYSEVT